MIKEKRGFGSLVRVEAQVILTRLQSYVVLCCGADFMHNFIIKLQLLMLVMRKVD